MAEPGRFGPLPVVEQGAATTTRVPPRAPVPGTARTVVGAARRALRPLASLWLLAALLLVWELAARADPSPFLPPFSVVASRFGEDWLAPTPGTLFLSERFLDAVPVSLSRLARGWALAAVLGIAIGVLLGRSRVARALASPVIRFWMSVPGVAVLPIALQLFGVSDAVSVFLIAFGGVWIIATHTADGVAGVDPGWLRTARSLRLPRGALLLRVVLPAAAPSVLAGLRVSLGFGLVLMIVAELYATTAGLGHDIARYQQTFRYPEMWSAFLLVALLGIALNGAVDLVERRVLRWRRRG